MSLYFFTLEECPGSAIPDQRHLFVQKLPSPQFFFCLNCIIHQGMNLCQKLPFKLARLSISGWVTISTNTRHHPQTVPLPACVPSHHITQWNQTSTSPPPKAPILTTDGYSWVSSEYTSNEDDGFPLWKEAKKRGDKNTSLPSSKPPSLTSRTKSSRGLPWWSSG